MQPLQEAVDEAAERAAFSGVVRVDRAGETELGRAYGFADRAYEIPNAVGTLFAMASGSKALTALVVMALVERGVLDLATRARSLLVEDLPLIADDVTVEHLLAHQSGIGDYFDETVFTDVSDYVMPVPVHELVTTEQYLRVLDGFESVFPAGEGFAYNNGGYVLLALMAERASGVDFHDLVRTLVCEPAGMVDTAFLRSDELPGRAARGYLSATGLRTNVLHLPVLGSGDGGIYSTAADLSALWQALYLGRIVSPESVARMTHPHSDWSAEASGFGLGFQLDATSDLVVWLEGHDAGVSCASRHQPSSGVTCTVIANWSEGAWPVLRVLDERLGF